MNAKFLHRKDVIEQNTKIRITIRALVTCVYLVILCSVVYHMASLASEISHLRSFKSENQEVTSVNRMKITNAPVLVNNNERINEVKYTNKDPNYPQSRDWVTENIYFNFYDGERIYTNDITTSGRITRKPQKAERKMLSTIITAAIKQMHLEEHPEITSKDCLDVRYRLVPNVGIEADVLCKGKDGETYRVTLVQPLQEARVVYSHQNPEGRVDMNIIITMAGRVDKLKTFFKNLKNIEEDNKLRLSLTIVYYVDEEIEEVKRLVDEFSHSTSNISVELVEKEGKFSRGQGLHEGIVKTNQPGEIIFFCDVDMIFTSRFLKRCAANIKKSFQVYAPVTFSQYNPAMIYSRKAAVPDIFNQTVIADEHGYWRVWGYGMLCLHKDDYFKVGGYDLAQEGWGGEDLTLIRRIIRKGQYKVIRALDPGIFHMYHDKICSKETTKTSFSCLKVKASNLGSQQKLAMWIMMQQSKLNLTL